MIIEDTAITLKDGRRAVLRSAREEDVQGVLDYLRISAGETHFLLRTPAECGKYTYEGEKALFERMNSSPTDAMIVCDVEGEIAGNCQIVFNNRIRTGHRAEVAIALMKKYWGLGIGNSMFALMEDVARRQGHVTQLELAFVEGNTRARALYEKRGFRISGVHPGAIRLEDGRLLNEYLMIKEL